MQEVQITEHNPDGSEYVLALPDYNKRFVDALKAGIPVGSRRWNPEQKVWVVEEEWLEVAEKVIATYFPSAEVNYY